MVSRLYKVTYWVYILKNETIAYVNTRTTQDIENLNRPIAMEEIKGIIKNLSL